MNDEQRRSVAAYHDGELDVLKRPAVRALIENDPEARRYLDTLERIDHTLRSAFQPIVHEPIPPTVRSVLDAHPVRRWRQYGAPLGLAASLSLVVVLLFKQGMQDRRMQDQLIDMQQQIAHLRNQTLENVASGTAASWSAPAGAARVEVTPVRTYRAGDNRFCREYEERIEDSQGVELRRGVACRAGKARWPDLDSAPPATEPRPADGARLDL